LFANIAPSVIDSMEVAIMLKDINNCLSHFLGRGNVTVTTRKEEGVIAVYVWGKEKDGVLSDVNKTLASSYRVRVIKQKTDSIGEITFIEARREEE